MNNSAASEKISEDHGVHYFDAGGALTSEKIGDVRKRFSDRGAVHITNTGITDKNYLLSLLPELGFGEQDQFSAGGRTTASWQTKWIAPGLRQLDYYPPHLYLLPNGEVTYQKISPSRILFFCSIPPAQGGRTFLHSSKKVERHLSLSQTGNALLKKIVKHGLTIEVGFLDAQHSEKPNNYFQSWQERFGSGSKETALATAQSQHDEYDTCWWEEDAGHSILMTRITLPGFIVDKRDGDAYLRFPRIAMDPPGIRNGFRRFPFGNNEEFTENEKALLRECYASSREGFPWKSGDIILMDNIRYGHSREPFTGPREILIGMAGWEHIEKNRKESKS
jgi:hypothetical protein